MSNYNKLYANILILFGILMFEFNCKLFLYKYRQENLEKEPLNDIVHNFFPNIHNENKYNFLCSKYYGLGDAIVSTYIIVSIFYLSYYNFIKIISDTIFTLAILFLFRSIAFSITTLPCPIICTNKPPFLMGGCGDLLFSGHYINFTVLLYVFTNKIKVNLLWKILLVFSYISSIFITLICRHHYSVDVWISVLLSYSMSKIIIK